MDQKEGLSILGSRGWLAATPAEFRTRFLSLARWRHVRAGSTVTLGGEENDAIIGLAKGTIAATSVLGRADTPIMHIAHAVLWMGYGPMFLDRPRVVTVEARTDLCVAVFPKARVLPLLDETTQWWRCFMRLMVEYGDITASIASDLLIRDADQRLAATILRFAGLRTPSVHAEETVRLPVTQSELADAANMSRNTAGRILRRLVADGLVGTDYRSVVVLDPDGLRRLVDEPAR